MGKLILVVIGILLVVILFAANKGVFENTGFATEQGSNDQAQESDAVDRNNAPPSSESSGSSGAQGETGGSEDFGENSGKTEEKTGKDKFIDSTGKIRRVDINVKEPEKGYESTLEVSDASHVIEINSEVALEVFSQTVGNEKSIEVEATMSDGSKRKIEVLPEDVFEITRQELETDRAVIELREEDYAGVPRAIYHVETIESGKILGIWEKSVDMTAIIDSETGEVLFMERGPWWRTLLVNPTHTGDVIVFPVN